MQKRAFYRIKSKIKVRFNCSNTDYSGTATNLSENGMFISTKKMSFPFDSQFKIVLSHNEDFLYIPVKVVRITKSTDSYDGVGVAVIKPSKNYLELVARLGNTTKG